jgi:hypothetical protein
MHESFVQVLRVIRVFLSGESHEAFPEKEDFKRVEASDTHIDS